MCLQLPNFLHHLCVLVSFHQPTLRGYSEPLTSAMVEVYLQNQARFTAEMHPHYIYSPRELSKWTRALYEGLQPLQGATPEDLVRLWLHEVRRTEHGVQMCSMHGVRFFFERHRVRVLRIVGVLEQGLRLFCDRLVTSAEQKWCSDLCDEVALRHFPSVSTTALERPIMYSKWLSRHYSSADKEELRKHIQVCTSCPVPTGLCTASWCLRSSLHRRGAAFCCLIKRIVLQSCLGGTCTGSTGSVLRGAASGPPSGVRQRP